MVCTSIFKALKAQWKYSKKKKHYKLKPKDRKFKPHKGKKR